MSIKLRISASFLVVVLLAAIWFQRQTLHEARAERTQVQTPAMEEQTAVPVDLGELEHLRQTTRELPRVRNEVRQLRAQTNELAHLRTAQQRLLGQLAGLTNAPPRTPPTPELGFVMCDTWVNAGVAAPEATIQTFFWALRHQNFEALATCWTPEEARSSGLINKTTGQWEPEALQRMRVMGDAPAYRIVRMESTSDDRVRAHIQAAVDGATLILELTRIGPDWKLSH